ncbi:uncharacterized protein LOC116012881 [Ipomoea triloba]|uniref:uncharacterized protein LOC116012881 n=1 Tax=Ipomoea triloba TaxID=35885 RepID=UPI00125DBB2B|nr:uncharacterized protein LOC116012881 [Ipomoea triloba]
MRKNQSYDNSDKARRTKYRSNDKASGSRTQEKDEAQMLCYNCRKLGHFKAECPYPIVKKHQDEHNYRKNSGNYHNSKNTSNDADDSSSESDSSEDEKGLLCLFSQEDSEGELCLMADEEEVTSQNHSSNYSSESLYHENHREAFERMMKSFDDIEDSHFKLKEQNAKLLAERQDLKDLRSKNAEMLESISQLEKQVHLLKEECKAKDDREQNLRAGNRIIWYVDSGCSRHMTGDISELSNFKTKNGPKVVFGGNSSGQTLGTGDVKKNGLIIQEVSYVEGLKFNLLSTSQFCDKGYKVVFSKDKCQVISKTNHEVVLTAKRRKNMYVVTWETVKPNTCLIAKSKKDLSWEWHQKLNHLNFKAINKLARKELVEGLPNKGRKPVVKYFHIFGSKCFIHNNGKSHLKAFDERADEGIFMGYSEKSKAFRVLNKRTMVIEESIHVVFDESSKEDMVISEKSQTDEKTKDGEIEELSEGSESEDDDYPAFPNHLPNTSSQTEVLPNDGNEPNQSEIQQDESNHDETSIDEGALLLLFNRI